MKVWQVMLLYIHEKHPDNDAVKHTDGGHCVIPGEAVISVNYYLNT
jgi:hypothetical protein